MLTASSREKWNRNQVVLVTICSVISAVIFAGILIWRNSSPTWYGYVVGEDRRIYMVNLEAGELEWRSRVLEKLGEPDYPNYVDINTIDINRDESILYIASESGVFGTGFSPLIAVRLNDTADIVFDLNKNDPSGIVSDALGLRYISQSDLLYVSFLRDPAFNTILDPITGEIFGSLDTVIRRHYEVSPDGTMIAEIVPERTRVMEEGTEQVPAGILVRDLRTGETILRTYLEANRGLHPTWGKLDNNLVDVRYINSEGIFNLEVFDRESGKRLASHDLRSTFGARSYPLQTYATAIPGSDDVAMSINDSIVVFDPVTAEIKTQAYIGEFRFTEVVVTDKPLITDDS